MSWPTLALVVLVIVVSAIWYGLQIHALRDLMRRPRVRGDKKALWALLILCIPIAGALIYLSAGPTSFIPRAQHRGKAPPSRLP